MDHMVGAIEFAKHMVSLMERTHGKRHMFRRMKKGPAAWKNT